VLRVTDVLRAAFQRDSDDTDNSSVKSDSRSDHGC